MYAPRWRKSSHSGNQDCIEISHNLDAVRDTKHPAALLTVDIGRLLDALRNGQIDRRLA